ncbi:MAG: hypothetical protein WD080_00065 [Egibacteraceae bacterium]
MAPTLPEDLHDQALQAALAITDDWSRARALAALAPVLARRPDPSLWHPTVRDLAERGTPALLAGVTALAQWLAALTSPSDVEAVASAVTDALQSTW